MTRRGRRTGRSRGTVRIGRLLVVAAVAAVVILAGYAVYATWLRAGAGGGTTLVVDTYPSLLGGCGGTTLDGLLAGFDSAYGAHVTVRCLSGTLVSTLLAQKNAPQADVVVGLDEVTAPEADAHGLLLPYAPPALADVNGSLVAELAPDHAVTPYEWGYLAIDYNASFAAATDGAVARATFDDFATNASWAHQLVVEDPTVDIVGEEFLLWEIAYAQAVAHDDWTGWWQAVAPAIQVAPDWSTAFDEFSQPTNPPMMVVSYGTDPAYAAAAGTPGAFNATVTWANGTAYGWKTIYGLGIVNGTRHVALAQEFVNWFLGHDVQAAIPTNEWEYPANGTIPLPPVYAAALDPAGITPLNGAIPPATLSASLGGWLATWQGILDASG